MAEYTQFISFLMRNRYTRKMSYSKVDIIKVCSLIALFAFLGYSALTKFVFTASYNGRLVRVETDFRPCDVFKSCVDCKFGDQSVNIDMCRSELEAVFTTANEKCKGYLNSLNVCRNAHKTGCQIELGNIDSCYSTVTGKMIQKWVDIGSHLDRNERPTN